MRPRYGGDYGAFLLDPDGNSAEAAHHSSVRGGCIDDLWIRVADLVTSQPVLPDCGALHVATHAG